MKEKFKTVKEYISTYPASTQERLNTLRKLILKEVPDSDESISYGMPAYKLAGKPLVYFAGYEHHIGLYALPSGHKKFKKELAGYKQGKGSVQFPHDQPLPLELISKILKFRVSENLQNQKQSKRVKNLKSNPKSAKPSLQGKSKSK